MIPLSFDLLSKPSITDCNFVSIVSEPSFRLGKIPRIFNRLKKMN